MRIVCAVIVLVATNGAVLALPETQPATPSALDHQLDRTLPEVQFDGVGLSDTFDFLQDVSGANLMVNWRALKAAKVYRETPATLHLRNIKFRKALDKLLSTAGPGLEWRAEGNLIVVSTHKDFASGAQTLLAPQGDKAENAKTIAELDKMLPEAVFDAVGLQDTLDFLHDLRGVKFSVDWASLKSAGIDKSSPVSMRVRNVKPSQVLTWILRSLDGTEPVQAVVRDGVIRIASKSDLSEKKSAPIHP